MQRFRAVALAAAVAAAPFAALSAPAPSVYDDYHPGFADMMTTTIQPRHTKLGLAVRARNWTYATYEVGELRGAFGRIVRSIPTYEGTDTAGFMTIMNDPIDQMRAAIVAHDAAKADAAYARLTATCNECHGSRGRAYIVIRNPTTNVFPDQDFAPPR